MLLRLFASLFVLIIFSLFFFRFFNHSKIAVSDPPGPQVRYFRQRRRDDDVVPVGRQSSLFQRLLLRLVVGGVFVVLFCCHPPRNVRTRNKSNIVKRFCVVGVSSKKSLSSPLYLNTLFSRDEHDETRTSRPNGNSNDEEQREEYFFFLLFFFEK